ncbi:MAG: hypothetical protein ACM3SW_14855 [Actinomycetota bacterium]
MPLHFNIYRVQPETGERVLLHERIPEQLTGWLCKMCDLELSAADRANGWVIMQESLSRPVKQEHLAHAKAS